MISYAEHGYDVVVNALHSLMNVTQQGLCTILGVACKSNISQFPSNIKDNGTRRPIVSHPPAIIAGIRPYKTHFQPASTQDTVFYTTRDGISTTASAHPSLILGIYDSTDAYNPLQLDSNEARTVHKGPKVFQHWSTIALLIIILGVFCSFFRFNREESKASPTAPRPKGKNNSRNKPPSQLDTVIRDSDLFIKELDVVNIDSGFTNMNLQCENDTGLVLESSSQYLFLPPGHPLPPLTSNVTPSTFTKATPSLAPVLQTHAATKSRSSDFDDLYDVSDDDFEFSASKDCPDVSPPKEPTYKNASMQTEHILETIASTIHQTTKLHPSMLSASAVEKNRIEFLEAELKNVEAKCGEKHKHKEKEWETKCKRLQEQRDTANDNGRLEKTLDVISNISNKRSSKGSGIKLKALQKVEDLQAKLDEVEEELRLALSSNKVLVNILRATDDKLKTSEMNLESAETARRDAQAAHDSLASIHLRCRSTPRVSTRQRKAAEAKPASPHSDRPTESEQDGSILATVVVPIASPVAVTGAPTLTSPTTLHNLFHRSRSLRRKIQKPTVDSEAPVAEEGVVPATGPPVPDAKNSKPQISAQFDEKPGKVDEKKSKAQENTVKSGHDAAQDLTGRAEKATEDSTRPGKDVNFDGFRFDVSAFQFPSRDGPPISSPAKSDLAFNPFVPSVGPSVAKRMPDQAETLPKPIQSISHTAQVRTQPPVTLTSTIPTDRDEEMGEAPAPECPVQEAATGMNDVQSDANAQAPTGIPEPMDYDIPPPQDPTAPTGIPDPMDYDIPPTQGPTAPIGIPEPMEYDVPPTQGHAAPTGVSEPMEYDVPPIQGPAAPTGVSEPMEYDIPPTQGPVAPTNNGSTYDFGDIYPEFDPDGPESAPESPNMGDEYDMHNPLIDFDDGFGHESQLLEPGNGHDSIEDRYLLDRSSGPHDGHELRDAVDDHHPPEPSRAAEKAVPRWAGRVTCSDAELLGEEDEEDDSGQQDHPPRVPSAAPGLGNLQPINTSPSTSATPFTGDSGISGVPKDSSNSSSDLSDHESAEFEDVVNSSRPASESHPDAQSAQDSERKVDDTDLATTSEDEEDDILREMRRLEEANPGLFLPIYDAIPSIPVETTAGSQPSSQNLAAIPHPEHQIGGKFGGVSAPSANDLSTPSTSSVAVGTQPAATAAPSAKGDDDDEFTISTPEQIKARKLKPLRRGVAKRSSDMTTNTVSNPPAVVAPSAGDVQHTASSIGMPSATVTSFKQAQAATTTTTESSTAQTEGTNTAGSATVVMAPPVGRTLTREELEKPPQFDDRWRELPGNGKIPGPIHTLDPPT